MWVKRLNSTDEIFRYEVDKSYCIEMMNEDESITTAFVLYKYWCNNDGEFEMCKSNYKMIVSLETLMSKFVEIDSEIDKELTELREFKRETMAEKLERVISPFTTSEKECSVASENRDVTNLDFTSIDPCSNGSN